MRDARVVIVEEGAAADARALRLDQRQHRLDRDRRVDRASAALQHLDLRPRGQRVGGDDERSPRRRRAPADGPRVAQERKAKMTAAAGNGRDMRIA